jgi:hypothetical protein
MSVGQMRQIMPSREQCSAGASQMVARSGSANDFRRFAAVIDLEPLRAI